MRGRILLAAFFMSITVSGFSNQRVVAVPADTAHVAKFTRKDFRNVPKEELAETYFAIAFNLALSGDYRQSIRFHKKAIRMHKKFHDTDPLEINLNLGLTYHLAGKMRKARKYIGDNFISSGS